MGRSQESFSKKEIRTKKEKKRKEKAQRRVDRKDGEKRSGLDDMIAYVDEFGRITEAPVDPGNKEEIDPSTIETSVRKKDPSDVTDNIRRGVVEFYNDSKGYGFIRDTETRQSIFFHANNLLEPVSENNIVNFETGRGPKGMFAMNIKKGQ